MPLSLLTTGKRKYPTLQPFPRLSLHPHAAQAVIILQMQYKNSELLPRYSLQCGACSQIHVYKFLSANMLDVKNAAVFFLGVSALYTKITCSNSLNFISESQIPLN